MTQAIHATQPTHATTALLVVDNLAIHVGDRALLQGISFRLHAGEALSLVGESGAGKSLLAQAIMGNLPPALRASGAITIDGVTTLAEDASARRALWGRKLALLPQEPSVALNPFQRVAPQLAEVYALLHAQPPADAAERAQQELARAGLGQATGHYPWQLSGGMAQRAVAAITLAGGAPVLMVDEPTKGLDNHWRDRTVALFRGVLQAGGCLLAITHDMAVAQALGGQVIVLRHGQAVEQGRIDEVVAQPAHPFTRQLMDADPARWLPFAAPQVGERVVQAQGISKAYGAQQLFAPMDLHIHSGERVAVQGPSGTGKSTLGNVLLGLLRPDTGRVARNAGLRPHAFQKLYQDPVGSFAPHISLAQSLRDAARLHRCEWKAVQRRLEQLRVPESLLERKPEQVSGGELQRIALARVLVAQPALLFADEPTSRLDPITQQEAMHILLSATQETGAALMLVTHDEHLAAAVATRRIGLKAETQAGH
ncbi:peptide/nickel transport system ATP-binding protein [Acidovorax sp. 56]|uniref:ABC transporter ATP-binding protein n=1 Tax=Acidovorax sp. 56 TaxID=2035205 RepID=UPI000C173AA7|nr:ATP-binding cassette domain-containing protein [Acidovorax sp. 56]PIF26120.1 peptide/nickel transport system ATP-binding protein [Acidovorax sp. 56]